MPLIKLSLTFLFILFLTNSVYADQLTVTDGDTIRIGEERIRFSGIDAPELKQTCLYQEIEFKCGEFSKNLLIKKIANQEVTCINESKEKYGRSLAECVGGKESRSRYVVREGDDIDNRTYDDKLI